MASLSIELILAHLTGITGTEYDQLSILNPDFTLNEEKLAVQVLKRNPFIAGRSNVDFILTGSAVVRCISVIV